MSKDQEHKLVKAAREAVEIAKCDHAFVMTPTQPKDKRLARVFCPRCEGTFTIPKEESSQ